MQQFGIFSHSYLTSSRLMSRFSQINRLFLTLVLLSLNGAALAETQNPPSSVENYPSFTKQNPLEIPKSATDPLYLPNTQAPIAFDNALTMEENADIWQRIKDGYAMPDADSNLVKQHEKAFTKKPTLINNIVDRSQKYLFHIVEEVQSRGMPTEIALLPMIESAYNPSAYSSAKAAGIWQFIPSTGKNYGLKQNWWVDNRRNITFATDAALSYLQKLHVMFGAWDLALAAYNAGEGTVRRAIEKNKRLGKPTNYASLDLPKETENYVPKLQAIKNIMTNPANFGIKLKPIENKAYFTTITAPSQIDAKLVADFAQVSYEEFIALNPGFNRPVITATSDTQELLLPVDAVEHFYRNLSTYDKPLVNWKPYSVKAGELLSKVAEKNDISVDKLIKINHLSAKTKFPKATIILVPSKNTAEKLAIATPQNILIDTNQELTIQTAQTDTPIESQLVESDVDISELQNAGNIDIKNLENLQNIQPSDTQTKAHKNEPKQKTALTHTVKNGETLDKIAKKYQVSTKTLVRLNHLKKNQIKAGQKLIIKPAVVAKNTKSKQSKSKKAKSTKTDSIKAKQPRKIASKKQSSSLKKSTLKKKTLEKSKA